MHSFPISFTMKLGSHHIASIPFSVLPMLFRTWIQGVVVFVFFLHHPNQFRASMIWFQLRSFPGRFRFPFPIVGKASFFGFGFGSFTVISSKHLFCIIVTCQESEEPKSSPSTHLFGAIRHPSFHRILQASALENPTQSRFTASLFSRTSRWKSPGRNDPWPGPSPTSFPVRP